jgi:hypothetical protein
VSGADAYEAVAAGWHDAGEPARARAAIGPLLAATGPRRWAALHTRLGQSSSASS